MAAGTGEPSSSPRTIQPRRPRLRACVTEPSITTSNASRGALASPQSAQRATDLLSRVAVFTHPTAEFHRDSESSSLQSRSTPGSSIMSPGAVTIPSTPRRAAGYDEIGHSYSDCYFSFPNFDAWEAEQDEGTEVKAAGAGF